MFFLLNVLQWCAIMNMTSLALTQPTHTHHGYLPGLWDAVLHDACHVSDGEVDVLLTEVFLAAVAFLMVMQALIPIICEGEGHVRSLFNTTLCLNKSSLLLSR